eukprot:jgi/Tetstr1/450165/TSEL_037207.t1
MAFPDSVLNSNGGKVLRKLLFSTGKAAWIAGSTFLVLVVPLIIEMDREQQYIDLENQQVGVLTGGASSASASK